jgi:protein AroM
VTRRIAALTIGQSPRPDLLEQLRARLPDDVEILEVGALDPLVAATLPRPRAGPHPVTWSCPLTTRLRDGTLVTLDETDLAPLVQAALERGEEAGAEVTLLLRAGGFRDATARGALVRPFDSAVERVRSIGARRIAVVVPIVAQAAPAVRKWTNAGLDAVAIVGEPTAAPAAIEVDAIVLDYVGHPAGTVAALRDLTDLPVVDLGECGAEAAVRHFVHHAGAPSSGAS